MIGQSQDAEDVVSEVFLAIHKAKQNGGGPTDNIRAYLRRAIQNEATRVWARRRVEDVVEEVPERQIEDPSEALLRAMGRARELGKFSPTYAHILFLMDILGETADEAAPKLGLSVAAAKSTLHRARSALRLAA